MWRVGGFWGADGWTFFWDEVGDFGDGMYARNLYTDEGDRFTMDGLCAMGCVDMVV